ncbi:MAG: PspC domain-containing protein [Anaerolineae bacterium]|jgi:phage shock protein C|nr:PspC domain-containing protein [Anaerolineae bacterium]
MMNEPKRLYRSESDVMLGGVCAGLGEFFDLDPTIIRLIFVVLFLTGSLGFWVYVVMWIVVPLESAVKGSAVSSRVVEGRAVSAEKPAEMSADEASEEPIPPLDLNDVE